MTLSRRTVLGLASLGIFATAFERANGALAAETLKKLGAKKHLVIGSAMSSDQLNSHDAVLFVNQLSRVTPENELKMTSIRRERDEYTFKRADTIADFAKRASLDLRGHTLIWNNDRQPSWLSTLSAAEMRATIEEYIERVMGHYDGRIKVWDVINEPVGNVPFGSYRLRDGPFLQRLGPDYIALAFRAARAVAPHAKLVLNETHTERDDQFGLDYRKNLLYLIDRLLDAGVPIDGIGLQGHLQPDKPFDADGFGGFLNEIARRNLFIEITELDVNDSSLPDDVAVRDQAVAETYRRFLRVALAHPVASVSFWQLGDGASWYYAESVHEDPMAKRRPRPLLYDLAMKPKLAFEAVAAELTKMPDRASLGTLSFR